MPRSSTSPSDSSQAVDYDRLLDPEIRSFIQRTSDWYPPETIGLAMVRQREIYNAMCRAFRPPAPAGVEAVDGAIDLPGWRLKTRRYRLHGGQGAAAIVYYHGGGFVLGDLESHDDVCADLCAATGFEVLSVDYRLAPEHRHPAAFDDACATFDWAAENLTCPILLCGESAGGNLAAAVSHARRGRDRSAIGQVLIYPSLSSTMSGHSYREHAAAPMLTVADIVTYQQFRLGNANDPRDARLAPLDDEDFSRLPATVIVTAQCDPLSTDGESYRDRIAAAGGRSRWVEEPGLVHSFLRARKTSRRASEAFEGIVAALGALGRGDWPY